MVNRCELPRKNYHLSRHYGVNSFSIFFRAATLQKCGVKIFSVFVCQRCREIWREIFRMLRFPGFECLKRKISPKRHAKNGVNNRQFHINFTLLGRGAEYSWITKITLLRQKLISQKHKSPELTVRKSFKSPVKLMAPTNNSGQFLCCNLYATASKINCPKLRCCNVIVWGLCK